MNRDVSIWLPVIGSAVVTGCFMAGYGVRGWLENSSPSTPPPVFAAEKGPLPQNPALQGITLRDAFALQFAVRITNVYGEYDAKRSYEIADKFMIERERTRDK